MKCLAIPKEESFSRNNLRKPGEKLSTLNMFIEALPGASSHTINQSPVNHEFRILLNVFDLENQNTVTTAKTSRYGYRNLILDLTEIKQKLKFAKAKNSAKKSLLNNHRSAWTMALFLLFIIYRKFKVKKAFFFQCIYYVIFHANYVNINSPVERL